MKTRFLVFFLAVVLALPTACAAEKAADKPLFHPPQTEAERVLDEILRRYDSDTDLDLFIFNRLQKNHARDKEFALLFTQDFLNSAEKKRKDEVRKSCGGKYPADGLECDMLEGVQPIYCASDYPDEFLFRTVSASGNSVIISYSGLPEPSEGKANTSFYRMTKTANAWQLDGIDCGEGQAINMH